MKKNEKIKVTYECITKTSNKIFLILCDNLL